LFGNSPVLSEPTGQVTLEKHKAFLIEAIVSEREKLNSAEFTIEGVQLDPKWNSPGKVSVHAFVDIPNSKVRWDERVPISMQPHVEIPRTAHGIFVTAPGSAMYLLSPPLGLDQLILVPPDAKIPFADDFWTFDIRAIGLQPGWYRPQVSLEKLIKALERA